MLRRLHELGLSWQKAPPIHPEADRQAQEAFETFPAVIAEVARDRPDAETKRRSAKTGSACRR